MKPIELEPWTFPESYMGPSYPDYFYAGTYATQNRDSDCLSESNFAYAVAKLEPLGTDEAPVLVIRDSHWAVGWIEYVLIHKDNAPALAAAIDLAERYDNYPALDEDDWSAREHERAWECWRTMARRERIAACVRFRVSMFAARRDEIPDDGNGSLEQYLSE